ncbi:MAG TPA: hypothetical protein VID29_08845 [Solirubrobacteraceae bacterium]|jgi:hypothetical protein
MSRSELARTSPRYGRYVAVIGLVLVALITLNTVLTRPRGASGIAAGQPLPPFAVPLAAGSLEGDADVARHADEGSNGRTAACRERGAQILNVCELYERAPLVLALFVNGGSCAAVLDQMQRLAPAFPGVRFAAVAIQPRGERAALRRLVAARGLTLPVGFDRDGVLAVLYKVSTCPQLTFAYPGGVAQGAPLLGEPSPARLRARVSELAVAARARGWRAPR